MLFTFPYSEAATGGVLIRKGVLGNFAKFTRKHLCQSLCFNKTAGLACNFIKIETLAQVFSCEFCEVSKNTFFTEHLWATASAHYKAQIFDYIEWRMQASMISPTTIVKMCRISCCILKRYHDRFYKGAIFFTMSY